SDTLPDRTFTRYAGALSAPRRRPSACFRHFLEPAGFHIVHKAPHRNLFRNPRVRFHALYLFAHVFLDVAERVEMRWSHRSCSCFLAKSRAKFVVLECQHPAIRVVDDYELLSAQQMVRNNEGSYRVFRYDTPGIPN